MQIEGRVIFVGKKKQKSLRAAILFGGLLVGLQCAPVIKRDLSTVPAGQVGFDDMCGLQVYFDRLAMKIGTPPTVTNAIELQGKGPNSGRSHFAFETDFQLQAVREVLTANWRRLPDELGNAPRIEIEVEWSERAGVRRVVMNRDAELTVGRSRMSLPYHVCLSELLFGEPLYRQRRVALGLGPLTMPSPATPPATTTDTSHSDGGGAQVDGGADRERD